MAVYPMQSAQRMVHSWCSSMVAITSWDTETEGGVGAVGAAGPEGAKDWAEGEEDMVPALAWLLSVLR